MRYVIGFVIWIVIGLVIAAVVRVIARAAETSAPVTFIFGIFGAFVGGMLGVSGYVFHDPAPVRFGGILGALLGAAFFTSLYHYMARKAV
jgi:uncharacterized membrane protein YeaQ/YmgE (transglycosylase-associated protein family)